MRIGLIVAFVGAGCGRLGFDAIAKEGGPPDSAIDSTIDSVFGTCAGRAAPSPVLIESGAIRFCIDSTEVTGSQYRAFIASSPLLTAQPAYCAFNPSYVPTTRWPVVAGEENLPAGGMDWCDARAYCAWAGKRLCGRIGGGPVSSATRLDPTQSEWTFVCTSGGARSYPYAPSYQMGVCVDSVYPGSGPLDVGSAPGCEGGFAGVFDMAGNIAEWEDSCNAINGPNDSCAYRGGEYGHGPGGTSCGVEEIFNRSYTNEPSGGFRCCSDAL